MKKIILLFVLFIGISTSLLVFNHNSYMDKKGQYVKNRVNTMQEHYDIIYKTFKTNSHHFYNSLINNKKIMNILTDANNQDLVIKNKARTKLTKIFKSKYQLVDKLGIDVIHFQLPNNESFFRRHKPKKFGDNLTSVRYSLVQANKTKKPIEGLEAGKLSDAFRFVYPVFGTENQHLGSVEGSVTSNSFIKFMENSLGIHTHFVVRKDELDVTNNQVLNKYIKANGMNDFMRLKQIVKTNFKHTSQEKNQIKLKLKKHNISTHEAFSLVVDKNNKEEIVIFIPIHNVKKDKVIAYFIAFDDKNELSLMKNDYNKQQFIALFISLLLTFLIFRIIISKQNLEIEVDNKTSELKKQIEIEIDKNQKIQKLSRIVEESEEELKIINENLNAKVKEKTEELQDNLNIISEYVIYSKTNLNGIITEVSDAFCKISKYSRDELIGQNHNILRHPDTPDEIYKDAWDTIKSGEIWHGNILNQNKEGDNYWISTTISPKYDQKGILKEYIAIRYNITSQKNFEAQHKKLIKAEKMAAMGEMIGNIAHQWRQPLSVISTASTGMKMQKEFGVLDDDSFIKNCDIININAQYLSKTIDDFRDFIKGDKIKKVFNLKDNIDSFLLLVEGTIKSNQIKIILDLDKDIEIDGYQSELTQCLINLFNNAKDILNEKEVNNKLLFVTTTKLKHQAIIKVKDNAGGVPSEIINKIFEPYFTTKHKAQGTGLGLNMTYNLIVDGMNGSIEVHNISYEYNQIQYTGAEFIISLNI